MGMPELPFVIEEFLSFLNFQLGLHLELGTVEQSGTRKKMTIIAKAQQDFIRVKDSKQLMTWLVSKSKQKGDGKNASLL